MRQLGWRRCLRTDRKSTRLNSSHLVISYAVFCLKKTRTAPAANPSATGPTSPATLARRGWGRATDTSAAPEVLPFSRVARGLSTPSFFFNDTATTEIYTLSLHDALPIASLPSRRRTCAPGHRPHLKT